MENNTYDISTVSYKIKSMLSTDMFHSVKVKLALEG